MRYNMFNDWEAICQKTLYAQSVKSLEKMRGLMRMFVVLDAESKSFAE